MAELQSPSSDQHATWRPPSPTSYLLQIGFVGLGRIGYLMARNLAQHCASNKFPPLLVWNRTLEKSENLLTALGQAKIRIAKDPEQVALECDVIITNLANDAAVKSIYQLFTAALTLTPPTHDKLFIESGTTYPSLAGELHIVMTSIPHSHFITCPVFGTPPIAEKAQLLLIMSGDYSSKKLAARLLVPAIGRKIMDLGENVEKAPAFKLLGNSMLMGSLEVLSEAYTLARKSGIATDNVHDLVKEILPSPGLIIYSDRMANDRFDASNGFALEGGIKDASHVRRLMTQYHSPMPVIDTVHQHLLTTRALQEQKEQNGEATFETLDISGFIAGTRVASGLDGFDKKDT
ncbi:hypothetical protein BDZ94DRAFT_1243214 [Collybia nuda]|uniref:6-phosphogluconate dehydrogenase NADP-binding domain-containing protein n=1 Tax=Collybia nuda TaxID=64659 RepID=A0A9P5YIX6_9AGAR|nr:hypothetical protein BDZ94DRAFT_1243214 [Collybia nuda]